MVFNEEIGIVLRSMACKMKRLVMIPGQMDDVFCMKELKYIVKKFDEVHILTYPGNNKNYDRISEKYGVKYYVVKDFTLYSLTRCFSPRILSQVEFKREWKRIVGLKKGVINILKCLVYVFLYINFAINAQREYEKINRDEADDYLYGCWMSRGAFAVSYIHHNYKLKTDYNMRSVVKNCVVKAHGYDLYEERRRVNYIPFRHYIYENMENIYFISRKGREYYKEKYGWDDRKYHVCHLGTDKANITKDIKEKNTVCIVSCSSAWEVKRMDIIVDAIANIKDLNVRWVHLGDGPLFEEIKQYAEKKLSGNDNIEYTFLGRVDNSKIYEIYNEIDADFFINMSDSEGLPVSIMEANAFGIPTICRDIGGNPEIISDRNGIVLHYDDKKKDEFYSSINEFVHCRIDNELKYRRLSEGSFIVWNESFNAEKNYNEFVDEVLKY